MPKGLLSGGQQPAPQQAAPQPQQGGITEEMMQESQRFVADAMTMIHHEKTRDKVIERLKQDPVDGSVGIILGIVRRIESQREVSDEAKLIALQAIVQELQTVAESFGIKQFTEQEIQEIVQNVVAEYTQEGIQKGKYQPEEIRQAHQQAQQQPQQGGR